MPEFTWRDFIRWVSHAVDAEVPVQFIIDEEYASDDKKARARQALAAWLQNSCPKN